MYQSVKKQHEHFGILYTGKPRQLTNKEKIFYYEAFTEEANEYAIAASLEDHYDALLDLIVFATGALLRHGFDPKGIDEVVRANMDKELGPIKGKRQDFELDLNKPEGWKPPNLERYL